jgi:hypothetical protein
MHVFLSITLNEMGRKKDLRYIRIRSITDSIITGERCTLRGKSPRDLGLVTILAMLLSLPSLSIVADGSQSIV